jgi:hypothetical protein
MCDSCACLLPAQGHGDPRNITHEDVERGGLNDGDYLAATKTKVGPSTIAKVKANIAKTEELIKNGKLDKNARK